MAKEERFHLTKEGLGDLFRIGAEKTAALVRQHSFLQKFAQAVEIIPVLEKAGAVKFPLGWTMAKKASSLAGKSSDELDKLAFMAKHLPTQTTASLVGHIEKKAELKAVSGEEKIGALTQWFMGRTWR
jgi:hypothetical protein